MFNPANISSGLMGVVGWQQPVDPNFAILDASNLESRSGYYVDNNPMAKIRTLKNTQDYIDISDVEFNERLNNFQKSSIVNVCNAVFNEITYIDRQVLYKHAQNKINTVDLPDGFVGYKIQVSGKKNIAFEISRVLLDFEGTGDIELLLFVTGKKDPLFTRTVTISSDHQEEVLNWVVDNSSTTYKGDYYFGYLSNNVDIGTVKPFERQYENANIESCITYIDTQRGYFPGMSTNSLPDLETWDGLSNDVGLNPDITVFEDFTDLIKQNERLFARAIQTDMQIAVLSQILSSVRINADTRQSEQNTIRLLQEIEGQQGDGIVKVAGLRPALFRYIKEIKTEFEKLKSGYLPTGIVVDTMT